MKLKFSLISFALLSALSPSYSIAAVTFRLNNGMDVVLAENHSVPMIAANFVIRVGARDETWETWGAAHFLEHLLFNGTATRTQEQIYEAFDRIGAYDNAHTGSYYVDFMLLTARENFSAGFEILTDMVFNSTLPEDKFEKERGIVCEEIARSQTMDGDADRQAQQTLFGNSPAGREILGTVESIANLKRDDVLAFYHRWYVPNNMLLFVTGSFAADTISTWLEKTLEAYQPRELPPRAVLSAPDFRRFGTTGVIQRFAGGDKRRLVLALPAPLPSDPDYAAFTILTALLDKRFGKELPTGVTASGRTILDPDFAVYQLTLDIAADGPAPRDMVSALDGILKEFAEHLPSTNDIARQALRFRADRVFNSERLHYFGIMYAGDWGLMSWDEFESLPGRMERIKPADLAAAARKWLLTQDRMVIALEPPAATEDSTSSSDRIVTARTATADGLTVIVRSDQSARVFALHILVKNRWLWDKQFGAGAVDLLHQYLAQSAQPNTASGEKLEDLAATLKCTDDPTIPFDNYYTTSEYSFIRLEMLPDRWREGVELIAQLMTQPLKDENALTAARGSAVHTRGAAGKNPVGSGSAQLTTRLLPGSAQASPVYGDVSGLNLAALTSIRDAVFSPGNLIISVASPLDASDVQQAISIGFAKLPKNSPAGTLGIPAVKCPSLPEPFTDTLALGAPQGALVMAKLLPDINPADRPALVLANAYLSDRLGMELREKQGLAYSLGSSLLLRPDSKDNLWGYWELSIGTRAVNIPAASAGIREILDELPNHQFTPDEAAKLAAVVGRSIAMRKMSRIGQAFTLGTSEFIWGDPSDSDKLLTGLGAVTPEQLTDVIARYMTEVGFSSVVVR